MAAKTKTIGVRVNDDLFDSLHAVAEKTNLPIGHLVTESLSAAIDIIKSEPCDEKEITPRFLAITRLDYHWSEIESKDLQVYIKK